MVAAAILVLVGLAVGFAETSPTDSQRPLSLASLFPPSEVVPGWLRPEGPRLFIGDQIFQYMNGAGEIPRSYGFRQLATARYLRDQAALEVVLFEMEDPAAAYGYYSVRDRWPGEHFVTLDFPIADCGLRIAEPENQSAIRNPQSAIANPARLLPGFVLVAWKGHYTLVVRVDKGSVRDDVLIQMARSVLENIPESGPPPELLHYLPRKDSVPGSAKYVRGKAAFDAEVKFIPEDVFGLKNGPAEIVVAVYQSGGEPYRLVLLRYPNAQEADQGFRAFVTYLSAADSEFRSAEGECVGHDPVDQFVGAFQHKQLVGMVLEAPSRKKAQQILRGFRRFVERPAPRWKLGGKDRE